MIELLSPAGAPEAVIAAVQNGADAVYLGMGDFNARRGAKNFTDEEFEKAVRYCRIRGCKVYVTLNTLVNDREVESAVRAAGLASDLGADGIIIQDLGLIRAVRKALPDIQEMHVQADRFIPVCLCLIFFFQKLLFCVRILICLFCLRCSLAF